MRFPEKDSKKDDDERKPEKLERVDDQATDEILARREETRRLHQNRVDLLRHREQLVNIISQQQEVHQKLQREVDRKNKRLDQIDQACTSAQKFIEESQERSANLQEQLQLMRAQLARLKADKAANEAKFHAQKVEKKCSCDKCSQTTGDIGRCSH